jgi:hypothetical protein
MDGNTRAAIEQFRADVNAFREAQRNANFWERICLDRIDWQDGKADQRWREIDDAKGRAIAAHEAALKSGHALTSLISGPEARRKLARFLSHLDWREMQIEKALECWPDLNVELYLLLAAAAQPASSNNVAITLADHAMMNHRDIAEKLNLPAESLRKKLDRWRSTNQDGWQEVTEPKRGEPKYVYRIGAIRHLLT